MLGGLSKPIAILLLVGGVVWFVAEGYASSRARPLQNEVDRSQTTLSKIGPWACMFAGFVLLVAGSSRKETPSQRRRVCYASVDAYNLKKIQELYDALCDENQWLQRTIKNGGDEARSAKEHAWRAAQYYVAARFQSPAEWAYHLQEKNRTEEDAVSDLLSFLEPLDDPRALVYAVKLGMKLEEYAACESAHDWLRHHPGKR